MSCGTVAKAELAEGNTRSIRWLLVLTVVITGLVASGQPLSGEFIDSELSESTLVVVESTIDGGALVILSMMFGYWAIFGVGGSTDIEELRSRPYNSAELIGGKFLGRMALLTVIVLANYLTAGVVAGVRHGLFSLRVFVLTMVVTLLVAAVHVAIGMGTSLVVQSRPYAFAILFAVFWWYLFFATITLFLLQQFAVEFGYSGTGFPDWLALIVLIQPSGAIGFTRQALVPEATEMASSLDAEVFFLQDWVGLVVTICWIVLPLVVGYLRFDAATIE